MAFDEGSLPPPPYKIKVLTAQGYISEPWAKFMRQLFTRAGGTIALSNLELAELSETDLASITADIASLTASVATLSANASSQADEITTLQSNINDINQGRQL